MTTYEKDAVEKSRRNFQQLSESRKRTLKRDARLFINKHPGLADSNNFWQCLSARHVTEA